MINTRALLQVPRCFARMINIKLQTPINIQMPVGTRGAVALEGKCQSNYHLEYCSGSCGAEDITRFQLQSRNYLY